MMKSNKAKAMRQFTQWEMTTQQENRYGKYTTLYQLWETTTQNLQQIWKMTTEHVLDMENDNTTFLGQYG